MKKAFPAIIALICFSMLGLVFLQVSWIRNIIYTQETNIKNDVENSFPAIRRTIQNKITYKVAEFYGYHPKTINWEDPTSNTILWDNITKLTQDNIAQIIKAELDKNGVDLSFEFQITQNGVLVSNSSYTYNYFKREKYSYSLSDFNAIVLHLYINKPPNYVLKRAGWTIGASVLFTLIIFTAFIVTVRTMLRQKKLAEIKTDFINNMTHEFKTPLATISLAVDMLQNPKVLEQPDKLKYFAGIIQEEHTRMNRQVEKILQAAKHESNNLDLKIEKVDIYELTKRVLDTFQLRIEEKGGRSDLIDIKLKNKIVEIDEVHFTNVLTNLLDNAIKYSNSNDLRIVVDLASVKNNGVRIKIQDNGVGIPKDALKHVFEKFYRVPTGNVHNIKGFGLGLSYVKQVIDAHKGTIDVDSNPGTGTAFHIFLPNTQQSKKQNMI